jgi:hypothetical protein
LEETAEASPVPSCRAGKWSTERQLFGSGVGGLRSWGGLDVVRRGTAGGPCPSLSVLVLVMAGWSKEERRQSVCVMEAMKDTTSDEGGGVGQR